MLWLNEKSVGALDLMKNEEGTVKIITPRLRSDDKLWKAPP